MQGKEKQLLFSVGLKDCTVTTQTAGGPGGQHRNRVQTAVRIVHNLSGATGFASDSKSQHANKVEAFTRMAGTPQFKAWLKVETAKRLGRKSIDQIVDEMMTPANIKTEITVNGRWTIGEPSF